LMLRTARRYLRRRPLLKGLYDEEDAVAGSLSVLWADVESGKPLRIEEVGGLWQVFNRTLVHWIRAATRREAARKRGGPGIWCSSVARGSASTAPHSQIRAVSPGDLDRYESTMPLPETAAIHAEAVERLLSLLDSDQRAVVRLRLDGLSIPQIGSSLGMSDRTVNRILEKIRDIWRTSGLLE